MGKLFVHATSQSELYGGWRRMRENGIASHAEDKRGEEGNHGVVKPG
jgi:hypothetical protein